MLHLPKPPAFNFVQTIHAHGWYVLPPYSWDGVTLRYETHKRGGSYYKIAISDAGANIAIAIDPSSNTPAQEIAADVRWMLALDADFSEFYALCRRVPKLQHVPEQNLGRLLRCATVWENLVKTITTTNTAWSGTKRMCQKLVENWGSAFPTAETLADVTIEALKEKAGLGYRAPYVHELAVAVASGALDVEPLRDSPLDDRDLYKTLRGLKGVGDYAASSMMMLLGRHSLVPVDSIAHSMVSKEFFGSQPVTPKQIQSTFAEYGQYAGLAYWFWGFEGYDDAN